MGGAPKRCLILELLRVCPVSQNLSMGLRLLRYTIILVIVRLIGPIFGIEGKNCMGRATEGALFYK
jgi:hypothetical protein